MGRNTTADKTPLLENAEQNIGNSTTLLPQDGSSGVVIPQTNPPRLLNLTGGSAAGQTTTITMTVSRIVGAENPNPGFPGPVTGIIEFGNGGRFTRVEFDLAVGPFAGAINQATSAVEPQDGVVTVTVPTGVLRAYARYDNLLLAPLLGTNPPMSQAQVEGLSGTDIVGPGGPLFVTNPADPTGQTHLSVPPEPVLVKAMAAYFTKPRAKVYKTLNCYLTFETEGTDLTHPPISVLIRGIPGGQVAGRPGYSFWALPPFTRSVKILRFPNTLNTLDVLIHDGVRPVDYFTIPANSAPVFDVVGNENIIGINSNGNALSMLKLVCEIGI